MICSGFVFFLFKINLARILLLIQIDVKYAATIIKYSKAQNTKISSIIHVILEAARTWHSLPRTSQQNLCSQRAATSVSFMHEQINQHLQKDVINQLVVTPRAYAKAV